MSDIARHLLPVCQFPLLEKSVLLCITVRKSRWLLGLPWHCLHFLSSSVENEFDWSIGNSEGRVRRTNFTTVVCYFHVKFLQNLKKYTYFTTIARYLLDTCTCNFINLINRKITRKWPVITIAEKSLSVHIVATDNKQEFVKRRLGKFIEETKITEEVTQLKKRWKCSMKQE